jgi:hypothetical protein
MTSLNGDTLTSGSQLRQPRPTTRQRRAEAIQPTEDVITVAMHVGPMPASRPLHFWQAPSACLPSSI